MDSADALLDLHTAGIGSLPHVIRDRVLYGERRDRGAAEGLAAELDTLAPAVGLPVVTEYPAAEYLAESLQRSLAGAVLNAAGVPAPTLELGGHSVVEPGPRAAGVAGVYGAMVALGMLDAVPAAVGEPGTGVPAAPVGYPVRRARHPRTEAAGLVRFRVAAGDAVEAGGTVATVVTPAGERVDTVESDHDGYVVGRHEGLAVYEGDAVASMAVRDDGDPVAPRDEAEEAGV